jgi:hypothetical protein
MNKMTEKQKVNEFKKKVKSLKSNLNKIHSLLKKGNVSSVGLAELAKYKKSIFLNLDHCIKKLPKKLKKKCGFLDDVRAN